MKINKYFLLTGLTIIAFSSFNLAFGQDDCTESESCSRKSVASKKSQIKKTEFKQLPAAGKKCWINESNYFVYEFAERPKLGTVILKIRIFDKNGKQVTNFNVTGNSGMPSMRGAHDSGTIEFRLNKKGDYLLPVNIVMAGVWDVQLVFHQNEKELFRGSFEFKI